MKIEAYLLYTERLLSRGAVCPILGSVPAAVKIVLGVLQTGLATLFMILSTPFALCNEKAKEFFNRSFSHLVHDRVVGEILSHGELPGSAGHEATLRR